VPPGRDPPHPTSRQRLAKPPRRSAFSTKKFFVAILIFLAGLSQSGTRPKRLRPWQKGASIQSRSTSDFGSSDFRQSVDDFAATHANYVSLVFRLYQLDLSSTEIHSGADTPTDSALAAAIDYLHSKGLHVMLKPHLESYTYDWRAYINPSGRNTWFTNYGNMLAHYAEIAQSHGAEDFCLGTELISMSSAGTNSSNTANWIGLINRIRGTFSGALTYSAGWGPDGFVDEKNHIDFWSSLDYIGISAYFNLHSDNSVAGLKSAWDVYNKNDIGPLASRWHKPLDSYSLNRKQKYFNKVQAAASS